MKHLLSILLTAALMSMAISCRKSIPADLTAVSFIPLPVSVVATGSSYEIDDKTVVYFPEEDETLRQLAGFLSLELSNSSGKQVSDKAGGQVENGIALVLNSGLEGLKAEGYRLTVSEKNVVIEAADGVDARGPAAHGGDGAARRSRHRRSPAGAGTRAAGRQARHHGRAGAFRIACGGVSRCARRRRAGGEATRVSGAGTRTGNQYDGLQGERRGNRTPRHRN